MRFTSILALALPVIVGAQDTTTFVTSTTTAPAPTSTPDLLAACEKEAGGYKASCPRCLHLCANADPQYIEMCFYSVYSSVNGWDSQCWQHGGIDCGNRAVDEICGTA